MEGRDKLRCTHLDFHILFLRTTRRCQAAFYWCSSKLMDCLHLQYTHHDHHQLECTKMFHVQMGSLFRLSSIFREISILWFWIAGDQKVFLFWRISVRIEIFIFDELNFFCFKLQKMNEIPYHCNSPATYDGHTKILWFLRWKRNWSDHVLYEHHIRRSAQHGNIIGKIFLVEFWMSENLKHFRNLAVIRQKPRAVVNLYLFGFQVFNAATSCKHPSLWQNDSTANMFLALTYGHLVGKVINRCVISADYPALNWWVRMWWHTGQQ